MRAPPEGRFWTGRRRVAHTALEKLTVEKTARTPDNFHTDNSEERESVLLFGRRPVDGKQVVFRGKKRDSFAVQFDAGKRSQLPTTRKNVELTIYEETYREMLASDREA